MSNKSTTFLICGRCSIPYNKKMEAWRIFVTVMLLSDLNSVIRLVESISARLEEGFACLLIPSSCFLSGRPFLTSHIAIVC